MRKSSKKKPVKKIELSEDTQKIIANMDKVWKDLIAYKKSKNSPLVISRNGKIEFVDPSTL